MRDYWIKTRGKVTGPLRKSHLERMVREPITDFHAASQVMYQGLNNWTQAIYVEDLKDLFNETVLATKADPDPVGGNAYYTGWWGEMKSAMKRVSRLRLCRCC